MQLKKATSYTKLQSAKINIQCCRSFKECEQNGRIYAWYTLKLE